MFGKPLRLLLLKLVNTRAEKAGDKIIQLLSKKNKNTKTPVVTSPIENPQTRALSDYEITERVNQLLSGGRMRKFI